MKNTEKAFLWIVNILNNKNIPFQISGGFAAKIYGSPRELNDIDIDIPDENFPDIYDGVKQYAIYGPEHYKDAKWDALLMTLNYEGQEIDITGATNGKISNKNKSAWLQYPCDFNKVIYKEVFGITVPVISKEDLISYKRELDGEHQIVDIESIS
ncbi:MAG: hypothetical protein WAV10_00610 [Minisyncoccia bacterium]